MQIALSCDHRGTGVYTTLSESLTRSGHNLVPVPVCDGPACDYPDMAYGAASAVADGRAERAILICGSGIGMCIAANKVPGVRAALVHDDITAELSRRHNDANVLCLSADLLGQRLIEQIVQIWLSTDFEAGRHARRVAKITAIERGLNPASITDPESLDDTTLNAPLTTDD